MIPPVLQFFPGRFASAALVAVVMAGCTHGMHMRHATMSADPQAAGCCSMCSMGSKGAMQHGAAGAMGIPPAQATARLAPPMQMAAAGPMCGAEGSSCGAAAGGTGCACCAGMMDNHKPAQK